MSTTLMIHNAVKLTKYSRKLQCVSVEKPFFATTIRAVDDKGIEIEITIFSNDKLEIEEV